MSTLPRKIAVLGNLKPRHSTESHWKIAWESHGIEVLGLQEGEVPWTDIAAICHDEGVEILHWTQTDDLGPPPTHGLQWQMLRQLSMRGIPSIGVHLDLWWDLSRQHRAETYPFFRTDLLFTADGGHQPEWESVGVNHVWLPPGVSRPECELGLPRDEYRSELAFIGSWQSGYHAEWPHRTELVLWLQKHYRGRCAFWPKPGEHAIRNEPLRDLYASVDITVGDSCLTGKRGHFWSDRIPECLGRGGLLIHPWTEGLNYVPGVHLLTWEVGEWDALKSQVEWALEHPDEVALIRQAGRDYVLESQTYEHRVIEILDEMECQDLR